MIFEYSTPVARLRVHRGGCYNEDSTKVPEERMDEQLKVVLARTRNLFTVVAFAMFRAYTTFRSASVHSRSRRQSLRETLEEIIPAKQEQLKKLRSQHGDHIVGDIKVENIIGGMRGLKSMLWEASVLDPNEGIRFHGLTIPDCQKALPPAPGGKEMCAESMLWLLLTGRVPSEAQVRELSRELAAKGYLPKTVEDIIDALPKDLHPMTQFSIGVAALNSTSTFAAAYEKGVKKTEYWTYTLEDSLDLIAKLPRLAARIFRNVYNPGKELAPIAAEGDLVGNYVDMLGFGDNESMKEYLRLYIALHGDHEGGNVSAHTAHLVGSALSDPYLSYSAALLGLAGPLHGLANQEVLRWILAMQKVVGDSPSLEQIKEYLWTTLKSGRVVPGYGHGVLRAPDPRFIALQDFCASRPELNNSSIIQLVQKTHEVAPGVLKEHGKTKNPFPNVDATSGCLLYHYGFTQFKYYTVVFGVSRALGALTQLVWDRALGLPIERPKSVSLDTLEALVNK
ncbi:citrate synthase [Sistotremastrum niveocremeum HHB9708]|uniref:Citrate synthase n=1 Tax=Sistotremastrum niveocremeum HHB9708 TaxID=1314777 RepID=A0A165AI94_9AGAM|nr:citrate synthase [Sistotremastrum niveocremeum HHB9708]